MMSMIITKMTMLEGMGGIDVANDHDDDGGVGLPLPAKNPGV